MVQKFVWTTLCRNAEMAENGPLCYRVGRYDRRIYHYWLELVWLESLFLLNIRWCQKINYRVGRYDRRIYHYWLELVWLESLFLLNIRWCETKKNITSAQQRQVRDYEIRYRNKYRYAIQTKMCFYIVLIFYEQTAKIKTSRRTEWAIVCLGQLTRQSIYFIDKKNVSLVRLQSPQIQTQSL